MITILGWILIGCAAAFDARTKKIPLWMFGVTAAVSALAGAVFLKNGSCTTWEMAVSLVPGALLLLVSLVTRESVGYGDGLLLMASGPVFGWQRMMLCIPAALMLTALVSVVLLASGKADRKTKIPFVPFLAAGMGVVTLAF